MLSMQEERDLNKKKKIILEALAKTLKDLRGAQSQFRFCSENDISKDVISKCERAVKDPQLTTLCKIAEGFDLSFSELALRIENNLPHNFFLIEK